MIRLPLSPLFFFSHHLTSRHSSFNKCSIIPTPAATIDRPTTVQSTPCPRRRRRSRLLTTDTLEILEYHPRLHPWSMNRSRRALFVSDKGAPVFFFPSTPCRRHSHCPCRPLTLFLDETFLLLSILIPPFHLNTRSDTIHVDSATRARDIGDHYPLAPTFYLPYSIVLILRYTLSPQLSLPPVFRLGAFDDDLHIHGVYNLVWHPINHCPCVLSRSRFDLSHDRVKLVGAGLNHRHPRGHRRRVRAHF